MTPQEFNNTIGIVIPADIGRIRIRNASSSAMFDNKVRATIDPDFHELILRDTTQWYVSVWRTDWKQNKKYAIDPEHIADEAALLELIRVICAMGG